MNELERSRSKIEEVRDLSLRLQAIGEWQRDNAQQETGTCRTLIDAAAWLKKLSAHMCCQGYIGCRGGAGCASDHK